MADQDGLNVCLHPIPHQSLNSHKTDCPLALLRSSHPRHNRPLLPPPPLQPRPPPPRLPPQPPRPPLPYRPKRHFPRHSIHLFNNTPAPNNPSILLPPLVNPLPGQSLLSRSLLVRLPPLTLFPPVVVGSRTLHLPDLLAHHAQPAMAVRRSGQVGRPRNMREPVELEHEGQR